MRAGELREQITIQKPTTTPDVIGGQTEGSSPTVIAERIPAAVEPLAIGQERLQVAQLRSSVSKRVRIRFRSDVTTAMHVIWHNHNDQNDMTLEIGAIDQSVRRDELYLYCAVVQQ